MKKKDFGYGRFVPSAGSLLFELAICMSMISIMMATLFPLIKPLKQMSQIHTAAIFNERLMAAIESYAISRMKLPCPAAQDNGLESIDTTTGGCRSDHGFVPWKTLGIAQSQPSWRLHVASLSALGPPLQNVLLRLQAIRTVPIEQLSRAVFNPPGTAGLTPATAPAFQICDASQSLPASGAVLCPGSPLSGSAVLVVVPPVQKPASAAAYYNQTSERLFVMDILWPSANNLQWLSYERLMKLWLDAGVLP